MWIKHNIEASSDLWPEHIALKVSVNENTESICVVFSVKNGTPDIPQGTGNQYIRLFKNVIEDITNKREYQWAKDYELILEYV